MRISLSPKKIRQINSLVLVKTLLSRNFCQKRVTVNFRIFHFPHCAAGWVEITEIYSDTCLEIFRKNNWFTKEITKLLI